jgi:hypothetical protein
MSARNMCLSFALLGCLAWMPVQAQESKSKAAEPTQVSLFDGKTLKGWSGLPGLWSVQDGAITGVNTAEAPIAQNTFIVYEKPVGDFELELEFKIVGGNSGIQYRSKVLNQEKFVVGGYQADIDSNKRYMGIHYEEQGRGIMAERGEIISVAKDGTKSRVGSSGDADALLSRIRWEDWNRYRIVAKGTVLQHYINDTLMSELQDGQSDKAASEGVLALQLHAGPPMKVQFKNIMLKSY